MLNGTFIDRAVVLSEARRENQVQLRVRLTPNALLLRIMDVLDIVDILRTNVFLESKILRPNSSAAEDSVPDRATARNSRKSSQRGVFLLCKIVFHCWPFTLQF